MTTNSVRRLVQASVLVAMGSVAGMASAATLTITQTTPSWNDPLPNSGVILNQANGSFTDVRWGTPAENYMSGLGFDPAAPPSMTVSDNTNFLLGTLRHYNYPVYNAIDRVDLSLATTISSASPAVQNFEFRFLIDETENQTPCAYPSTVACADRITFQNLTTSSSFNVGGSAYTLQLVGFSSDNGSTFTSSFISNERSSNDAKLYARFTSPIVGVPEPATLSLLGLGLLGLAITRRRKSVS